MKKDEKFPGLANYKLKYLSQRIGAAKDTANAIDLINNSDTINQNLVKTLKKELNEIFKFARGLNVSK
ncbi:hypothetical protein H9Y05_06870 [Crocinitomicaceae bacterium CZZ-1]|uniref:Uncharacterized protein n=1 Tax=Taishania pollutisoli TaxID=2766479 RepID=A0A8J6P5H3_9FLAO|nr:hypothetical protein [Taishania pollutisoli]MBC9812199.1 hypothetical protein [Taishania pollutisoli]